MLAKRNAAVFEGTYKERGALKAVLVPDQIAAFLEAKKHELASWSGYNYSLARVAKYFARKYLHEVTTGDCEEYRRQRLAGGAAPATARKELRYLQSVFKDAQKHELCDKDPVSAMSFKGIRNSPEHAPAASDIKRLAEHLLGAPPESYLRPLFFVLLCTGMRLQSALSMRWEDVDYERGCIGITQKGNRRVWPPMPALLRGELQRWEPESRALGREGGYVFPGAEKGTHLGKSSLTRAWNIMLKQVGVSGITRHDMRRFLVTRLRALGADNKAIERVSGHSTAAMIDLYDKRGLEHAAPLAEQASDLKSISEVAELERKRLEAKKKS